jgi:hypothetical protein
VAGVSAPINSVVEAVPAVDLDIVHLHIDVDIGMLHSRKKLERLLGAANLPLKQMLGGKVAMITPLWDWRAAAGDREPVPHELGDGCCEARP